MLVNSTGTFYSFISPSSFLGFLIVVFVLVIFIIWPISSIVFGAIEKSKTGKSSGSLIAASIWISIILGIPLISFLVCFKNSGKKSEGYLHDYDCFGRPYENSDPRMSNSGKLLIERRKCYSKEGEERTLCFEEYERQNTALRDKERGGPLYKIPEKIQPPNIAPRVIKSPKLPRKKPLLTPKGPVNPVGPKKLVGPKKVIGRGKKV